MALRPSHPFFAVVSACLLAVAPVRHALAQDAHFGSLDDPGEAARRVRWDRERHIDTQLGLSLIGAEWRTAARTALHFEGFRSSVDLEAAARTGIYGSYGPDFDEPYDLLRLVRYARLDPAPGRAVYVRLGPLRRTRLGPGHLVSFLSGETVWNERRIGLETAAAAGALTVYGFAQDVRLNTLVGARVETAPLGRLPGRAGSSLRLGLSWVSDRSTRGVPGVEPVEAWQADVRFEAARSGAFALEPFVSVARFTRYGRGLLFGADLVTDDFIDLARMQFRLAVHYGGRRFIPGYFGAFYGVHSETARIVSSDDAGDRTDLVGIPLRDAAGGNDVMTELRVHFFDRFEFWYAFKRHYGGYPISEYHLRLFLRARRFRLSLGQDRADLTGFFSVFGALGDQTSLHFASSYRVIGRMWIHAEARYTYERVGGGATGSRRYLVQRWFEPYVGLRIPL